MLGVVDTQFHVNDGLSLPSESRYAPVEEIIAGWASGASTPKGCSATEFAESVAADLVGSRDGLFFKGPIAGTINALSRWAPRLVTVS